MAAGRWELLLALGRLGLLGALDLVWPENISAGGSGGEVEAITPLACAPYSSFMNNKDPNPLPSKGKGAAR